MRITEAMGVARGDVDAGVLTSSRKIAIAGPTRCAACAPRENASEWIEVRATIVPVERQSRQAISDEDT